MLDTTGSAAAPAARYKNVRRGSFTFIMLCSWSGWSSVPKSHYVQSVLYEQFWLLGPWHRSFQRLHRAAGTLTRSPAPRRSAQHVHAVARGGCVLQHRNTDYDSGFTEVPQSFGALAALDQEQEPERTGGKAGSRRGLGSMQRLSRPLPSLRVSPLTVRRSWPTASMISAGSSSEGFALSASSLTVNLARLRTHGCQFGRPRCAAAPSTAPMEESSVSPDRC
jgi:hypothetical protein